jgi:HEAT repeat protein
MKRFLLLGALAALPLTACSSVEKRLLSGDPQVRVAALDYAAKSPESEKKKIVAAMGRKLSHKRPQLRGYAATALEDIGPAAAAAAPALIKALTDNNAIVSAAAQRSLTKLPGAAPALAAALASEDPVTAEMARAILAAQGDPGALALAKNFESGNRTLALKSASALALMGPAAAKAVPGLARAALSNDADVRSAASAALSDIGRPAALWLADALGSASPNSRAGASAVLAGLPRPLPDSLEALTRALGDKEGPVRENCATALAAYPADLMASLPQEILPLLSAAAAGDDKVSGLARIALVRTGKASGKLLLRALQSPEAAQREAAALALILMFPPPAEPARQLFSALDDPELAVRRAAAAAIGNYAISRPRSLPKDAAAQLSRALGNSDPQTRSLAIFPLRHLAASDKKALAALVSALTHRNHQIRVSAADALASAGPKAASALPALWKAFNTKDCVQRQAAARALSTIKPSLKTNRPVSRALKAVCPVKSAPAAGKTPF